MEQRELELLVVRHGESSFNRDGTGGADSELTEQGREQARRLASWLAANHTIAAIYSSPLTRARQTAEVLADALRQPFVLNDDLTEVDFELAAVLPQYADPATAIAAPGVPLANMPEAYVQFQSRVARAFREIVREQSSGTVLAVTHGGVIATLLRSVFGAHQVSVHADNASTLLLRWEQPRWHLVYSNRTDYLR